MSNERMIVIKTETLSSFVVITWDKPEHCARFLVRDDSTITTYLRWLLRNNHTSIAKRKPDRRIMDHVDPLVCKDPKNDGWCDAEMMRQIYVSMFTTSYFLNELREETVRNISYDEITIKEDIATSVEETLDYYRLHGYTCIGIFHNDKEVMKDRLSPGMDFRRVKYDRRFIDKETMKVVEGDYSKAKGAIVKITNNKTGSYYCEPVLIGEEPTLSTLLLSGRFIDFKRFIFKLRHGRMDENKRRANADITEWIVAMTRAVVKHNNVHQGRVRDTSLSIYFVDGVESAKDLIEPFFWVHGNFKDKLKLINRPSFGLTNNKVCKRLDELEHSNRGNESTMKLGKYMLSKPWGEIKIDVSDKDFDFSKIKDTSYTRPSNYEEPQRDY